MSDAATPGRSRYVDQEVAQRLIKGADFTVLFLGTMLLFLGSSLWIPREAAPAVGFLALEVAFGSMITMRWLGLYGVKVLVSPVHGIVSSLAATFVLGAAVFAGTHYALFALEPLWLSGWLALCILHFALTRSAAALWARPLAESGAFHQRIAVVGGGKAAEDAIQALETSPDLDVEIVGLFDDRKDNRSPAAIREHRKLGSIAGLSQYARHNRVDLVIVAIPLSAEQRLLTVLKRLWELPVDIRICGHASALKLSPKSYTYLGKLPLLTVFDRPLKGWGSALKSAIDRTLATLLLLVLSPLMLATALAIRLESPGPVLFRQKRYGFNNEPIEVLKFRSMYAEHCDQAAARLVTRNDPRVTRVGRFIRRTSIDELPQLINVLKGELSLVGPRPHAAEAKAADRLYDQVVEGYFARHRVKPGITGWAQINGWRGETDTAEKIEKRVKHDLEYIDRWSLTFDLYILLKTPFALLKSENAY
jgi:Undecaprenyl-phosphate glucose phosphotransferase